MNEETIQELAWCLAERLDSHGSVGSVHHNGMLWQATSQSDDVSVLDEINGADCWGKVQFVEPDRNYWGKYGTRRPHEFDGAAEILTDYQGTRYWWQPTLETWGISRARWHGDPDLRRQNRSQVLDLLNYGLYMVKVTAHRDCAACGTPEYQGSWAIGGLEPFVDVRYLTDLVTDGVREVLAEIEHRTAHVGVTA
jgi:hypothetical protein